MNTITFGSLFAGIGGFDLGLEWAGMTCKWQVEIDPFCRMVLEKHWPHVERFADVRECGEHNLRAVDLIAGGFPCQPHSIAGKRRGAEDDRDLWPEYRRVIAELRPRWVVGENVPGIIASTLDDILDDLESLRYATVTLNIPVSVFGAQHERQRIFFVAHAKGEGLAEWLSQQEGDRAIHKAEAVEGLAGLAGSHGAPYNWGRDWPTESILLRKLHGIPNRVDRVRTLGNAVVPQVAEWIGRRIILAERMYESNIP